jgi:hypothetical protein
MRDLGGASWLISVAEGETIDAYYIGEGLICATLPRLTAEGAAASVYVESWAKLLPKLSKIAPSDL